MKSNPPAPIRGSRLRGAELPHLRLDGGHLAWGEHPGQEPAMQIVGRRILEDDGARRASLSRS